MLKLFLILLGAVYIGSIISVVLKLFRMRTCLRVLANFLGSCSISSYGELIKKRKLQREIRGSSLSLSCNLQILWLL